MGFDLRGVGGYFRWSISMWWRILRLAQMYGWEPLGTEAPKFYNEDGILDEKYSIPDEKWNGIVCLNNK